VNFYLYVATFQLYIYVQYICLTIPERLFHISIFCVVFLDHSFFHHYLLHMTIIWLSLFDLRYIFTLSMQIKYRWTELDFYIYSNTITFVLQKGSEGFNENHITKVVLHFNINIRITYEADFCSGQHRIQPDITFLSW
jgi:hypothetical protein